MAATKLLSDNGVTSGITGYQLTGGNDGTLQLQTTTTGGTATTAMTIDTAQQVGIGVAPNAWAGGNTALQMAGPSMWGASGVSHWSTNTYFDGTNYKYIASNYVSDYYQLNGMHVFRTAASGTAGANVSALNESMRIDASGNVGINTTPSAWGSAYRALQFNSGAVFSNTNGASLYTVQNTYFNGTNWIGSSTAPATIYTQNSGVHSFFSDTATSGASFTPTERVRFDASGNVGIGVTSPAANTLSLYTTKNLSWQWANTYNYANIFNQENSAALVLGSGYQRSSTANGVASSVPVSWAKTAVWVGSESIKFYTDSATTVAVGTDVTPTERVRLDSSGRMRVSYQPSFSAYSPQSVGTGNIVKYTSTRSNVGSCYDTSTGVFTAPIAGVYVFSFNSLMNVNGDYVRLLFRWNGVSSTNYGDTLSGGVAATAWAGWSYISIGMSWVVSLGQGDTVSVWNDGPCTTYGPGYGTFSGYMLG